MLYDITHNLANNYLRANQMDPVFIPSLANRSAPD